MTEMTPKELQKARKRAGLTQTEAAKLVYRSLATWRNWELGRTKLDQAAAELFLIKTNQAGVEE